MERNEKTETNIYKIKDYGMRKKDEHYVCGREFHFVERSATGVRNNIIKIKFTLQKKDDKWFIIEIKELSAMTMKRG